MTNFYSSISPEPSHDFCLSFSQEESSFNTRPRIVLLGEFHDIENNYFSNAYLIQKLYRPGDIVLVEQVEGENPDDVEAYLKERLLQKEIYEIHGWEDAESDDAIDKEKMKVLHFAEEIKGKEIHEEEWNARAKEIFKNFDVDNVPFLKDEDKANIKEAFKVSQQAKPEEKKKALTLFLESIPYTLWTSYSKTCKQILVDTFIARQRSLAQKISEYTKEDNTVFVIAGTDHLLKESEYLRLIDPNMTSSRLIPLQFKYIDEQFYGKSIVVEEKDLSEEEKVERETFSKGVNILREYLSQKKMSFHVLYNEGTCSNRMQVVRKTLGQPLQEEDSLKAFEKISKEKKFGKKTASCCLTDALFFIISKIQAVIYLFLSIFKTFYKRLKVAFAS